MENVYDTKKMSIQFYINLCYAIIILKYNAKEVFEIRDPEKIFLPKVNVSTSYVFCRSNDFFAYPNNYNYYVNYYKNTFQHGGVSMNEMLVPVAYLTSK